MARTKKNLSEPISLRIAPELKERLDARSEAWGTPALEIIRMALRKFLDEADAGRIGPGGAPTASAQATARAVVEILKEQEMLLTEEDRKLIAYARALHESARGPE